MQHDLGAARDAPGLVLASGRDLEAGAAGGRPGPDFAATCAAADHDDLLRHHESGIKADTELADQAGAVLGFREPRHERLGPGTGNGAEIVDQFLPLHADAAVGNNQRVGFLAGLNPDLRRLAVADQRRIGDRLITQSVAGVRRVGDQFAQENVGLRIDRMHHQVQQFGNLGLERLGDGVGIGNRHWHARDKREIDGKTSI